MKPTLSHLITRFFVSCLANERRIGKHHRRLQRHPAPAHQVSLQKARQTARKAPAGNAQPRSGPRLP